MSNRSGSWGAVIVAGLALGAAASAVAQEPSRPFSARAKEYWEKVVSGMESGAKSAGDEYHKLKAEAAEATGPAREKLSARMEAAGRSWAAAREKLSSSLERHAHEVHDEVKVLEEKAERASGPARDKMAAEAESLRKHWHAAREKLAASFSSNMKASGDEYTHLKDEARKSTEETRARLAPRMDRLKAEWHSNREKLAAHLKDDLKRTDDELHKVGEATTEAARATKEKLTRKLHDLRGKSEALASEKAPDEAP